MKIANSSLISISWLALLVAGCTSPARVDAPVASAASPTSAAATAPQLEIVARLPAPPGNVAVTPQGRMLVSMHPFGAPADRVLELLPDGSTKPFPSAEWSRARGKDGVGMTAVIGIRADRDGRVYMLDAGGPGQAPRLIVWSTGESKLERTVDVPASVLRSNSFLQDFALDAAHGVVFIADMTRGDLFGPSDPAIVALELETGRARRLLGGHPSVAPDGSRMVIDGRPVTGTHPSGGQAELQLGLNPITIDPRGEWVYFGAMHGRALYRVRSSDLRDVSLSASALGARVERVGAKGVSDGITVDDAGNVYVTDLERSAIGVVRQNGSYDAYLSDARLQWPDGFGSGADGYIYVTVNQLHRLPPLHAGTDGSTPPYLVARFKPLAAAVVGR